MNRWTVLSCAIFITALLAMGCSGTGTPVTPDNGMTDRLATSGPSVQTHLWGYWDVYIDIVNQTVEAVPNRGTTFTANVVTFVNKPVTNLAFEIHGTPMTAEYVDVDIDVSITHPFAGITQYNGYDVRGIFMGQGSGTLMYDPDLEYAVYGSDDQVMYDFNEDPDNIYEDPYPGLVGMPDGYTRWWNLPEFPIKGVLGYTDGALATKGYTVTTTLNPYKYFADNLGVEDGVFAWLEANNTVDYFEHGMFSAGTTNTRNYYLRFPLATGVKYGYAIAADWANEANTDPPPAESHMVETPAISVAYNGDVYFVDGSTNGGNFIADVDIWSWDYQPSTVTIETNVHSVPVTFDDTNIIGGTADFSTWHTEFSVDNVTALDGNEFWVIAEYSAFSYNAKGTEYSVPGTYPDVPLAAFFRYDLATLDEFPCVGPTVTDVAPDTVNQGSNANVVVTGTDFIDGTMLDAWLTRAGQADIAASTVTYVDATEVDCQFTIPASTELGMWNFNMTHDECPSVTTVVDAIEVVAPAFDIHFDGGSAIGNGVTPTPGNGSYTHAIDISVKKVDGGLYVAWSGVTDSNNPSWGNVQRFSADGATSFYNDQCDPNGSDTIWFTYRRVGLDANSGDAGTHGWAAMCDPVIHFANNDTGTSGTNQSYGFWYGSPYWWTQDAVSPATNNVYSYANFLYYGTHYRTPWEHGLGGNWDNASANYSLQTPATDFDGSENVSNNPIWDDNNIAMTMGSNRDSTFWNLHKVAPHVNKYTTWQWYGYTGANFGADGTGDGQIAASNFSGGSRVTGPVDITTRDANDKIYVLDEPTNGWFRIQAFDQTGAFIATSGEINTADYSATEVYRMDYNNFEDYIYVLLNNGLIVPFIDDTN